MALARIARVGDTVTGTCTAASHGARAFTGTWTTSSSNVTVADVQVILVGDSGITDCGHTFHASTGGTSTNNGIAIHRVGDQVTVDVGGSGTTTSGSPIAECW